MGKVRPLGYDVYKDKIPLWRCILTLRHGGRSKRIGGHWFWCWNCHHRCLRRIAKGTGRKNEKK